MYLDKVNGNVSSASLVKLLQSIDELALDEWRDACPHTEARFER